MFCESYCFIIELQGAAGEGDWSLGCSEASEGLNLALIMLLLLQNIEVKIAHTYGAFTLGPRALCKHWLISSYEVGRDEETAVQSDLAA